MRDMTHTWLVFHCAITRKICITWLNYLWHDSSISDMTHLFVTWLIYLWHDSSICDMTRLFVTWLIYLWHDSSICHLAHLFVTWLMYWWHDSSICDTTHLLVTWLISMYVCTTRLINISHASSICGNASLNERARTRKSCVTSLTHDSFCNHSGNMRDMTHLFVTWLIFMYVSIFHMTHPYVVMTRANPCMQLYLIFIVYNYIWYSLYALYLQWRVQLYLVPSYWLYLWQSFDHCMWSNDSFLCIFGIHSGEDQMWSNNSFVRMCDVIERLICMYVCTTRLICMYVMCSNNSFLCIFGI